MNPADPCDPFGFINLLHAVREETACYMFKVKGNNTDADANLKGTTGVTKGTYSLLMKLKNTR